MPLMTTGAGRPDSLYVKNVATGVSVAFFSMVANNPNSVRWEIGAAVSTGLNPGAVDITATAPSTPITFELTPISRLTGFSLRNNALTGSWPDLRNANNLTAIDNAINSLTGPIFDLRGNPLLTSLNARNNTLSGNIPTLAYNPALTQIFGYANLFTGVESGFGVTATLGDFEFNDCLLTQAAVDAILAAFVAAGRTSVAGTCILNVGATGNAAPSAAGLTNKATLVARGWTVTTN